MLDSFNSINFWIILCLNLLYVAIINHASTKNVEDLLVFNSYIWDGVVPKST